MGARYDIIGDIHGMVSTLRHVLSALGYKKGSPGQWSHPDGRVLISVGDLLDRGPAPLDCLELISDLVRDGCAQMVLGNHEVNALHYETRHRRTGEWLRAHSDKNRKQFSTTALQITRDPKRWERLRAFLRTVPTRLALGEDVQRLQVVHACWGHGGLSVADLPLFLDNPEALERTADEAGQDPSWQALECCLKGPEEPSAAFPDKDGHVRTKRRVAWWEDYPADAPMTVFGHYWFPWPRGMSPADPAFLGPARNAVCLDYSLGKKGRLAVLRWPEKELLSFGHVEGVLLQTAE